MSTPPKTEIDELDLDSLPVARTSELTARDERLLKQFEEIDLASIERLIDGGKRLVEWGTATLGILFAALALADNPAIQVVFQQITPKLLGVAAVIFYLLAITCGFVASMPRLYRYSTSNLGLMQQRLEGIYRGKYRLVTVGSLFFTIGSAALGALIIAGLLAL